MTTKPKPPPRVWVYVDAKGHCWVSHLCPAASPLRIFEYVLAEPKPKPKRKKAGR